MSQDIIEINGKRYHARSGEYLGKAGVIPDHIMAAHGHHRVIDGIHHRGTAIQSVLKPNKSANQPVQVENKTQVVSEPKTVRQLAHVHAHHPQKSKTLIRRSVKRPVHSLKPAIKVQAPAEVVINVDSGIKPKLSATSVSDVRKERAARTNQHQAIRHFQPSFGTASSPMAIGSFTSTPNLSAISPAPVLPSHHAVHLRLTSSHKNVHHKRAHDLFEAAIARATSHTQPHHKPTKRKHSWRRKLANGVAVVSVFLVIGGFVSYLKLPSIEMRVASFQAGFSATMPGYVPEGYALDGGVKRFGGVVTVGFRSGDSNFSITQQASNWNSQTLLDNTLALSDAYKTVQSNGQVVYIYADGLSASWVNSGIRYDMTGNAQLTSKEIVQIATSL